MIKIHLTAGANQHHKIQFCICENSQFCLNNADLIFRFLANVLVFMKIKLLNRFLMQHTIPSFVVLQTSEVADSLEEIIT